MRPKGYARRLFHGYQRLASAQLHLLREPKLREIGEAIIVPLPVTVADDQHAAPSAEDLNRTSKRLM